MRYPNNENLSVKYRRHNKYLSNFHNARIYNNIELHNGIHSRLTDGWSIKEIFI